jgi:hypothetical protein
MSFSRDLKCMLAMVGIQDERDLHAAERLHAAFPDAWIVFVVPQSWLGNAARVDKLLGLRHVHDICPRPAWLERFWFMNTRKTWTACGSFKKSRGT